MWNNVRDAFPSELRSMYQSLRAEGIISYEEVEQRFETHQHTWPEAIFNEDAYFKYVKPFIDDGEDNLAMCLGSKEQQRKWWLYNRFRYIDSKYTSGTALSSYIQARVYHKSDLNITPYADIYASALFDSNLVQARAARGTATTVASPDAWDPGGADAVLRIYSADQIKSLGDLSGFYVGDVSFAAATKLQSVKLGDSDSNYSNEHLVNVGFGNNTLLQSIDIRNCPNLVQMLNVSGCTGLETVHLEGTNVAGITLPEASAIQELYLPASITNLTLKNQSKLETLEIADMSNIETLWVEGGMADDAIDMIDDISDTNTKLRIVGFNKTFESDDEFNNLWDKIRNSMGLDDTGLNTPYAYLDGTFTINELKRGIYDSLSNYPFLTINYTTLGDYMYKMYLENSNKFTTYSDSQITKIRDYALLRVYFKNVNCPNVTEVGASAFYECRWNSASVNLPKATVFGDSVFYNAGAGTTYKITSLTIGKPTVLGTNVFLGVMYTGVIDEALDLSEIQVMAGNSLRGSGFSKELRLPNTLTEFSTCGQFLGGIDSQLIDVPNGVNYANAITEAFIDDVNLTTVILRSTTMLNISNYANTFRSSPIRQAGNYSTVGQGYVYVPSSLVDAYKADWATKTYLADLAQYIRAIEDYPEICDSNYQGGE